jgi:hypothetical protein
MNWQIVGIFWLGFLASATIVAICAAWFTWLLDDKSRNQWRAVVSAIVLLIAISFGLGLTL